MFKKIVSVFRDIHYTLCCINVTLSHIKKSLEDKDTCKDDYYYIVELHTVDSVVNSEPLATLEKVNLYLSLHPLASGALKVQIFKKYDDGR